MKEKSENCTGNTDGLLPVCIDLDGTLIYTDCLFEACLIFIKKRWFNFLLLFTWGLQGKAMLKKLVSSSVELDQQLLPYNHDLLEYLKRLKQKGHPLILATASDEKIAENIVGHLDLFDGYFASDGQANLKGEKKAKRLVFEYGVKGFIYAGNSRSDLAVWKQADSAIVVNASNRLSAQVAGIIPIKKKFTRKINFLHSLFKELRCYQWTKNSLVFIAPLAKHNLWKAEGAMPTINIFLAFCLVASGVYLINDLLDLDADRRHPRKKKRPFANGDLPIQYGILAPLLIISGLVLSFQISPLCFIIVLSYMLLSNAYSIKFKQWPLLDVFVLAALYTIRIIAGGVASGAIVSIWLLNFSGFLFLALGFLKRYGEYFNDQTKIHHEYTRRGYSREDSMLLLTMGVSSSFMSALVLGMYVNSNAASVNFATPVMLWGFVPLLLFWQCRLWLATVRGYMHDDPIVYAAKDWVSQLVFLGLVAVYYCSSIKIPVFFHTIF